MRNKEKRTQLLGAVIAFLVFGSPALADKTQVKQCIKNEAGVSFSVDTYDQNQKKVSKNQTFNLGDEICHETTNAGEYRFFAATPSGCSAIGWVAGFTVIAAGNVALAAAGPFGMSAAAVVEPVLFAGAAGVVYGINSQLDKKTIFMSPGNYKQGGKGVTLSGTCFSIKTGTY